MKLKLYLNDWFVNMGVIGFIRIIENADKKEELVIKDNYIEFDSVLLESFHEYYFQYFMKRYDICKRESEKLDRYLNIAKKEEKFKDAVKWIKGIVDTNRKKIKGKFKDKTEEEAFNEIFKKLSAIKKYEQYDKLQEIVNEFKNIMGITKVNDKLTINYVRSIFSTQYFGQASFLQRTCASKDIKEQSQIMYKDYVKQILEEAKLEDNLEKCEDIQSLEEFIKKEINDNDSSKDYIKALNSLKTKFIKKKKSLEDIKTYLEKELLHCSIWEQYRAAADFTEGVFVPLGVSNNNARNFMWDFNTSYPICSLVKFILLCTPAGAIDMQNGYFGFVNMDTNVNELYNYNENFRRLKGEENPFESLVYDIVSEASKKSKWLLQNILFIEFNASYEAKSCKLNYFNMPKSTAKYFSEHAKKDLEKLLDKKFKSDLVSLMLNNKAIKTIVCKKGNNEKEITIANDINSLIDIKLRDDIRKNNNFSYDCLMAALANHKLNKIKKGCEDLDNKKIWQIFKNGQELNSYFKNKESGNKIQGIAYRLLNASKAGNKKEFMDTLLRIYMAAGKEVPSVFLNVMHEKDLEFETVAHSFISGLISSERKEEAKGDN